MKKLSLLIILCMVLLFGAVGCQTQVFVGNSTSSAKQFLLDYTILNSTKTHDIKLEKGSTVNVIIENKSGNLDIIISDTNGEKIYKGDNAASGKFSLQIPKTDTYKFSVTGRNAKGSVSFKIAD